MITRKSLILSISILAVLASGILAVIPAASADGCGGFVENENARGIGGGCGFGGDGTGGGQGGGGIRDNFENAPGSGGGFGSGGEGSGSGGGCHTNGEEVECHGSAFKPDPDPDPEEP